MNKTRRNLIIATIVLNFLDVAYAIGSILWSAIGIESLYAHMGIQLTKAELRTTMISNIVLSSIELVIYLSAAICLILHLKLHDKKYDASKKLFFAGWIINILGTPFSIPTLLLLIAYFKYLDIKVDNEEDVEVVENSEEDIKSKIEKLRKLKEEGVISEEEFKEEILKLL